MFYSFYCPTPVKRAVVFKERFLGVKEAKFFGSLVFFTLIETFA